MAWTSVGWVSELTWLDNYPENALSGGTCGTEPRAGTLELLVSSDDLTRYDVISFQSTYPLALPDRA